MNCRRCRSLCQTQDGKMEWRYGRVFVDRLYPQDKRIELACLQCGHRWFIKNNYGNAFSRWLIDIESQHRRNYGISS